jgi:hypothetical protein
MFSTKHIRRGGAALCVLAALVSSAPAQAQDVGAALVGGIIGGVVGGAIGAAARQPAYVERRVYVVQPRQRARHVQRARRGPAVATPAKDPFAGASTATPARYR